MEDDVDMYLMIREEYQRGSSQEEAFKNICEKKGLDSPPCSIICKWFERYCDRDHSLYKKIGDYQYGLLYYILGNYLKFRHAIFKRDDSNFILGTIIDNRFLFVFNLKATSSASIVDLFDVQSRYVY